jgi:hypothetical protein
VVVIGVIIAGAIWYRRKKMQAKRKLQSAPFSNLEEVEHEKSLTPHGKLLRGYCSVDLTLIAVQNWKRNLLELLRRQLWCPNWKLIWHLLSSLQVAELTIMN